MKVKATIRLTGVLGDMKMITGEYWRLQNDEALQKIETAALTLLQKVGFRIQHERLLDIMESGGCSVSRVDKRCRIPERLVWLALEHYAREAPNSVSILSGWSPTINLRHSGSHPHYLDWPSGERRLATKQDVENMAKMAHMLSEIEVVGRVLTCGEVDPRIEPLWTTLLLAQTTDKPIGQGEVVYAAHIEPLVRMGEIISGKPGDYSLIPSCDFVASPLTLKCTQAECFLEKRRFGIPFACGSMPISGLNAPVTVAGTVTLSTAEILAGWTMSYLVNPEIPVSAIVASGTLDMRTGSVCFGSPEALLQDIATMQFFSRRYGVSVWPAINYTDCKRPGLEAVYQKMLPLVGIPFGVQRNLVCDGLLSAGQDYSPVQQILEAEISKSLDRFWGGFEVNSETIAVELIEEVIAKSETSFLETDHTLMHYQDERWYPRWMDRTPWQGTSAEVAAETRMLERIHQYVCQAINSYCPPDFDSTKISELRRLVEITEKELIR